MDSRRDFIKKAGLFTASAALLPHLSFALSKNKIGLQLYSLRDLLPKDPKGVIQQVAHAGYTEVEVYGLDNGKFWGMTAKELKKFLKENGLKSPSGHYGLDGYLTKNDTDELKRTIEASKELGNCYLTIPYLGFDVIKNGGWEKLADKFNEAALVAKKSGLQLAYHNHDFEFKKVGDSYGLEILLSKTDPKLVDFEADLYWVVRAGYDPIKLFQAHPGRFKMWHVKDMDKKDKNLNAEVGSGQIDFKSIFAQAKLSGLKHFFVEHETNYKPNPIGSVTTSAAYIKNSIL